VPGVGLDPLPGFPPYLDTAGAIFNNPFTHLP